MLECAQDTIGCYCLIFMEIYAEKSVSTISSPLNPPKSRFIHSLVSGIIGLTLLSPHFIIF
ncbi:MAG: hypothetical protein A2157_13345 [Deltaproteobacteria bacterium RBG_16_47_11]|nr:MAG: hypothetical protein A2157_13345 [Deltaproteobacteria bacterium RBG_16_47_11]